jgi:hypothetical protein
MRAERTAAIAPIFDGFYNVHRLHASNGQLSPIELGLRMHLKLQRDAA